MKNLQKQLQERFIQMEKTGKLFRSKLTGDQIWDLYLKSFTKEHDPIFRDPNSTTHNCNHCKNFIRRYGNIVALDENLSIMSIFDVDAEEEYSNSMQVLSECLKSTQIENIFFETFNELNSLPYETCKKSQDRFQLGISSNPKRYTREEAEKYGVVKPNEIRIFDHMFLSLDKQYVDQSGKSIEALMGEYRDAKNVFKRGLDEISLDTLILVKDLIAQGSLLDGTTHLWKIDQIIPMKRAYDSIASNLRDNWSWYHSYKFQLAKFKNELIGVLCSELSEGKELNEACQAWNKRVDPINYMKTTAPITKKQIEEAKKFVQENGYEESFNRRFATMDDIKVSEILHSNIGDGKIKSVSIFDNVKSTSTRHKRSEFDGVEEIGIDKFMSDILPNCTSVEAFLTNQHNGNLVSLTTANDKSSKAIFKWNNNYSWTFNGNLAGKSQIKDAINSRGGKTEGVLNIRLHFPNTESDYDLHVVEPNGDHIYYSNRRKVHSSSGMLDLDAQGADGHFPPEKRVENIIYTDLYKMPKGSYRVFVNNYNSRDRNFGFIIEIEIGGEITVFKYDKYIGNQENITVCNIKFDGKNFDIQPIIPISDSNSISKELYGLESNQFHKVNLVCLTPNHWDTNNVGNKHYLFMLDNCKSPIPIRSFHNENLIPELAQHRKVLEVLGTTAMIESTDKQLSGLGFNATVRDELLVRLTGSYKRVVKIKF